LKATASGQDPLPSQYASLRHVVELVHAAAEHKTAGPQYAQAPWPLQSPLNRQDSGEN
jgi:hypothetical protein